MNGSSVSCFGCAPPERCARDRVYFHQRGWGDAFAWRGRLRPAARRGDRQYPLGAPLTHGSGARRDPPAPADRAPVRAAEARLSVGEVVRLAVEAGLRLESVASALAEVRHGAI